jgi:AAA domain (dynein-related subfamily)
LQQERRNMATAKATTAPLTTQIYPSDLISLLDVHAITKHAAFIWGPPGIGKSAVIAQYAAMHGYELIDIRLSQFDNTDIRGIPYRHPQGMKWELPSIFPRDPNAKAIIFFDELAQAEQSVRKAAFQIILDRRIGEYVVPENVIIIAASNRTQDRSGVSKLEYALKSRFVHYDLAVSFDDFANWAITHDFNTKMLGFLSSNKHMLHEFDPVSESNGGMSPRQWAIASNMWNNSGRLSLRLKYVQLEGCVGKSACEAFKSHINLADKMPSVASVFDGTALPLESKNPAIGFSLGFSLLYEYRDRNNAITPETDMNSFYESLDRMFGYLQSNVDITILVTIMKSMKTNFNLLPPLKKTPALAKIMKTAGKDLAYLYSEK